MKKLLIVFTILTLFFAVLYAHAYSENKKSYIRQYNLCLENKDAVVQELKEYERRSMLTHDSAKKCMESGGCFITCGSGCGLPKPTISIRETISLYLVGGSRNCLSVCVSGCLYPPE